MGASRKTPIPLVLSWTSEAMVRDVDGSMVEQSMKRRCAGVDVDVDVDFDVRGANLSSFLRILSNTLWTCCGSGRTVMTVS